MGRRTSAGVTLLELMVTIAVLAIGSALAYPSFSSVITSNRLAAAANGVIAACNLARSEAIRSNRGGGVCPSSSGVQCDSVDWNMGVLAFTDLDNSGGWSTGDVVIRHFEQHSGLITWATGASDETAAQTNVITFRRSGRTDRAVDITIAAAQCQAGQQHLRLIEVTRAGQIRLERQTCP